MKSCFFIGHREANERLLPKLKLEVERLITEEQVRYFYVGGYGGIAATAPVIQEISWSIPSAGRKRDLSGLQILPRGWE